MSIEPRVIDSLAALEALYDAPMANAITKEVDHVTAQYRRLIEASPFVVVATAGADGVDCSPRGDPAGFVRVMEPRRLVLPDRRGNNRIDSLRNLLVDPRIALLFLIPGVGETLRVNGRARIVVDPALAATFAIDGKPPVTLLDIAVERVYYQCPKALIRARIWEPEARVARASLPSSGDILAEIKGGDFDAAAHDRAYPDRIKQTIY